MRYLICVLAVLFSSLCMAQQARVNHLSDNPNLKPFRMSSNSHEIAGVPPYVTDGEQFATDPAFAMECAAAMRAIVEKSHLVLSKPLITQNQDFGLVWRVDYKIPGDVESHINRLMCWKLPFTVDWSTATPSSIPSGIPTQGPFSPVDVIGPKSVRNSSGNAFDVYNYPSFNQALASTRTVMVTTSIPANTAGVTCPTQ